MPKFNNRTPDNERVLRKLYPTTDNEVIAQKLGITVSAVRSWAYDLQINKSGRYWTKRQDADLLKHYGGSTMTIVELAKMLGKTRWACINRYRQLKGLRH